MVLFTLGTGVGGAIIIGDCRSTANMARGRTRHTIIDYNETARLVQLRPRGHLEAYASATAVIRRTRGTASGDPAASVDFGREDSSGEAAGPLLVAEEAEKGDAVALAIVLDTARFVGIAVVNAMHTIDPSGVI